MLWIIAIVTLTIYFYFYLVTKLKYFKSVGVKTLPPVPLLGNLTDVTFGRENLDELMDRGYREFKNERYFGLYQYMVPVLIPRDLELIRQIMVRDFNSFFDRGMHMGSDCDPLVGRSLLMLKGNEWRRMRAALSPAFSPSRMHGMAPLMAESANCVSEFLRGQITKEKVIDVNDISTAYANDVIASCAFGLVVDSLKEPNNPVFALGKTGAVQDTSQALRIFGYENMRSIMKLLNLKMIKSNDAKRFSQLFESALRARRERQTAKRTDFIQTLVDVEQEYTDHDLVSQAVLFYVAGYDPTANLINYFLYEMAVNPQIQERLQEELDNTPEEGDQYERIQRLEYLDMCVSEVLRLWPLVGSATRRSDKTYDFGPIRKGSNRHFIAPAGIHVWVPIFPLHRDEQYWPNPDQCDPERFSKQNKANIVPYTYLPFGTGPRHCIGSRFALLSAKIFIAKFYKEYSTKSIHTSRKLDADGFVLRPKGGFNIMIVRRDNTM